MLCLFRQNRNIIGLILAAGPAAGLLLMDRSFDFYSLFLWSSALSVPLFTFLLRRLSFRSVLSLCLFLFLPEVYCRAAGENPAFTLTPLFLGAAAAGLLLVLPPHILFGWYPQTKYKALACTWSLIFFPAPLWAFGLKQFPAFFCGTGFFLSAAGLLFCLQEPPVDCRRQINPLTHRRTGAFTRPVFFTLSMAASSAVTIFLLMENSGAEAALTRIVFWLFLCASPFLFLSALERKGVFRSFMLLLLFFASALLCLVLCLHPFFSLAGSGMAGLSAGGLLFLLPVLLSYLYGQTDYLESCSRILTCLPAGVFMVLPICRLQRQGQLSPAEPAVLLSCFLLLAFFCIFFAWKQRFLILKNQQM